MELVRAELVELDARVVAAVLGAAVAALGLLSVSNSVGAPLSAFAFSIELTAPRAFACLLLLATALLAWCLATAAASPQRMWSRAAIVLALLAVNESADADERVFGSSPWAFDALHAVAAVLVAGAALWLAKRVPAGRARVLLVSGVTGWLASQLVLLLESAGTDPVRTLVGVVELSALALVGTALLLTLQQVVPTRIAGELERSTSSRMRRAALLQLIPPGRLAFWLMQVVAIFGVAGGIVAVGKLDVRAFDLNREQSLPALFSALLLLGAAAAALAVAQVHARRGANAWRVLAGVFAVLGVDEFAALHEDFQWATGVLGQAFLAPILLAGAIAGLLVLRRVWALTSVRFLLLGGALAWVTSQALDALHHRLSAHAATSDDFAYMIVPEELLEMSGSVLFGVALLIVLRAAIRPDSR